jgi:hydroxyacylglutathione hydrolase
MKRVNSDGPRVFDAWPQSVGLGVAEFRERRAAKDAVVLDLRRPEAFGGAHVPGAINIGGGSQLSAWAAWVLPYDTPILLVGEAETDLDAAVRSLLRVGLDDVAGHLDGGMPAWIDAGETMAYVAQASTKEVAAGGEVILDVRSPAEWRTGHIDGAIHIPAGELVQRVKELPEGAITLVCGSGYRSSIAASLLRMLGRTKVRNMLGGMGAWMRQGLPVVA